ncbi:MAG: PIN domain-containing protein [Nocardioidaceae bacterium]
MNLFDSSALLCFLQGETGADVVERELVVGDRCSAVNWSEIAQKIVARKRDWRLSRGLLLGYGLVVEPVEAADAERAAALWQSGTGLSIADRLCLATAERLGATVWTADAAWGSSENVIQIR